MERLAFHMTIRNAETLGFLLMVFLSAQFAISFDAIDISFADDATPRCPAMAGHLEGEKKLAVAVYARHVDGLALTK